MELSALVGAENVSSGDERIARALVPHSWRHRPLLVVQPGTPEEAIAVVKAAEASSLALLPCGSGSKLITGYPPADDRPFLLLHSARLNRILDYQPEDMTVTCEAGVTLEALQQALSVRRQFLPLDCPLPERATLGGLVSTNTTGFGRPAYGAPRDLLIGMKAVMTDAVLIKGGGKVVKNVAGYDVCKLFTGAWGTIGFLTELTFKVRPMHEADLTLSWNAPNVETASRIGLKLHHSGLSATFALATNEPEGQPALIVGLQGTAARVLWQQEEFTRLVRESGLESIPITMGEMELAYLRDVQARLHPSLRLAARISCLPTELPGFIQNLEMLSGLRMTAHCASGTINLAADQPEPNLPPTLSSGLPKNANLLWIRLESELVGRHKVEIWGETRQDSTLQRALKQALDPRRTFSPGRFLGRV